MEDFERPERTIRTAIADDGTLGDLHIRELLGEEDDVELVGEYRDPQSAIGAAQPDLLFLAVQMHRRGSSLPVLDRLNESTAPVTIIVTSHGDDAVEAFDCNAIVDCLLNPFAPDRFRRSMVRARQHLSQTVPAPKPLPRPAETEYLTRLAVKTRGKVYLLRIEEIDWIETAGNYVRLHAGGNAHLYRDSLVDFETKLDPHRFVRIHRSNIVNIDRIAQLEPSFHREHVVLLRDGTRLTLTAPYRDRMRAIVGQF